jgi:Protein of unknown function (DUF3558)
VTPAAQTHEGAPAPSKFQSRSDAPDVVAPGRDGARLKAPADRGGSLPRHLSGLLIIPALIVVLGGCGSGAATGAAPGSTARGTAGTVAGTPGAPPPAAGGDPCRFLSQADIQAALGGAVGPGKQVATLQDCVWGSADFSVSADLTFSSWDAINAAAHGGGSSTPKAVSGIGDEAYTGPQGTLYVRKGDQGFLLLVGSPAVQHATDNGVAIAKLLAAKILAQM